MFFAQINGCPQNPPVSIKYDTLFSSAQNEFITKPSDQIKLTEIKVCNQFPVRGQRFRSLCGKSSQRPPGSVGARYQRR